LVTTGATALFESRFSWRFTRLIKCMDFPRAATHAMIRTASWGTITQSMTTIADSIVAWFMTESRSWLKRMSMASTSLPKRETIRPDGVASNHPIGADTTDRKHWACKFSPADVEAWTRMKDAATSDTRWPTLSKAYIAAKLSSGSSAAAQRAIHTSLSTRTITEST